MVMTSSHVMGSLLLTWASKKAREPPASQQRLVEQVPPCSISLLQQIQEDWPDLVSQAPSGDPSQVSGWPCGQAKAVFVCDVCGKPYASEASLNRHTQAYHWGRRFRCLGCLDYWTTNVELRTHQQITGHQGQDIIYLYGNLAGGEMFPTQF